MKTNHTDVVKSTNKICQKTKQNKKKHKAWSLLRIKYYVQ